MHILTFDIEEWFHLLDHPETQSEASWSAFPARLAQNMARIHHSLDARNQKATFFCLGWVARKYPQIIRDIADRGHEIATHSDLHQLAYTQTRNQFRQDLERSIHSLEDLISQKVRAYRAPGFSIKEENKWALEELLRVGIEIDCSVFPAKRAHGGFEHFGAAQPCWIEHDGMRLKEFPINLHFLAGKPLIFSGGGYFRLFPLWVLQSLIRQSPYVMTYFHPRDFDANQPMVPGLSKLRQFKSYYGLKNSLTKLEQWLDSHTFIDLSEADQHVDWSKAPIIHL